MSVVPILRYDFDAPGDPTPNTGSLGSAADGDIAGSNWLFTAAPAGLALTLDGSTSVEPNAPENAFDVADADFGLHARMRCAAGGAGEDRVVAAKRDNNGRGYALVVRPQTGRAVFEVAGSQAVSLSSNARVDDGAWHDLIAVRQGNLFMLYVDGVLEAQAGASNLGSTANGKSFRIGRPGGGAGGGAGFVGELDTLAVFDVAVTPIEVLGGADCNHNGIDDAVEISSGAGSDCDGDGVLDQCEGAIVTGDCNANGLCDAQEMALGLVPDANGDGTPDDCQAWFLLPYGFDRAFVFGDSLSDPGNVYAASQQQHPQSPPNYEGRFSNGPVWCEYLAGYLGLSPGQVTNLAFGGAATGRDNSINVNHPELPDLPGLADQVDAYRLLVQAGQAPTPSTLFVVWIGPNDFNAAQQAGSNLQLDTIVHGAMANIEWALRELAQLGAQTILVPNMPDLGATPLVRSNPDPELPAAARTATIGFNANLAVLLAELEQELSVDFIHFDAFGFYDELLAEPASFGFSDVVTPCLDEYSQTACAQPATRLFWDELHPTTAGHRRIALRAQAKLLDGGDALPRLPCATPDCTRGSITFTSPSNGLFTQADAVTVAGSVSVTGRRGATPTLAINGVAVALPRTGQFSAVVPLDPARIEQPIVATLRMGDTVLDRERVVVFRGPSLTTQSTVGDAVVAQLSTLGIGALTDELNGRLLDSGALDIRGHLLSHGWIASNFSGEFQYTVAPVNAGFLCSSVDIVPGNDRVFVRVNLHDLFIDYYVHGWFDTLPDPGIDCDGRVTTSRFSVFTELAFHPAGGPAGEIDVVQLTPLGFDLLSFDHSGSCATIEEIIDALPWIDVSVEQAIRAAIQDQLDGLTQQRVLESALEAIVREISIATPLGSALGVQVFGDIDDIDIDPSAVRVEFDARVAPSQTVAGATYAVPMQSLPFSGLDPASGQPSEFKLSLALRTLNQLLLAKSDELLQGAVLNELDLGAGPQPLTAGLLSALIPAFEPLGSYVPIELRLRPTLPPMLLGPSGAECSLSDLYLGQIAVEFVPTAGAFSGTTVLAFALDLSGCVSLGYDAAAAQLTAALHVDGAGVPATLIANRLAADEHSLELLIGSVTTKLVAELGQLEARFPLPSLDGMQLSITNIWPESGYVTYVVDVDSIYSRPDLIVESIDMPDAIDILFPFQVTGRIKNVGSQAAWGGIWLGASLSLDDTLQPWDLALGPQLWLGLGNGLAPGESRPFTLNLNAVPNAAQTNQTLFVLADVPFLPGGTGAICERSEGNNALGVQVLTTVADAYVAAVDPPSNVVGGIGPRNYRVRVGRNNVGIDHLWVPVRVTVGNPVVNWGDALVSVPRGAEVEVDVSVLTPPSYGNAGQVNYFPVLACANLQFDSNWGNNCASSSVGIAAPWWDLRFEIVNAPTSATHCGWTDWDVRVTNYGNVGSPNVCAITGITLNSGAGNWSSNLGIFNFWTPSIAPGGSWTYDVNGSGYYFVNCGALQTTQFVKAEVHYSAGCWDNYGAGNFDQQPIVIH